MGKLLPKPLHRFLEERFISLIESCRKAEHLHQVQAHIISHGFQQNPYLSPKIVTSFFKSQRPSEARQWFDQVAEPNAVLLNVMFKGYTEAGLHKETLLLFEQMKRRDVGPNEYTFTFVLKSCSKVFGWKEGEEVHCFAIKTGFISNGFVGTMLIDLYSSMGAIELAHKVFVEMPVRNVVAWTAMVAGCVSVGEVNSARWFFDQAVERDVVLWNAMISGYTGRGDMASAAELFARMPEEDQDVMSWNTVLLGYANAGDLQSFEMVFDRMPEKNVFSWNELIGGYVSHSRFSEALYAFRRMLESSELMPSDATLVIVLSACARRGALFIGRQIHVYSEVNGFKENVYVCNGLIDMYAKCGCVVDAMVVFQRMKTRDLVTWNAMIGGLATHGLGFEALELFEKMKDEGERPDGIAFVGVLSACVHTGSYLNGFAYFRSMIQDYSIDPSIEHYGCMLDLLGRAGLLDEAMNFVRKMPMEVDCVIWSALLGACQVHNEVGMAKNVMNKLVKLGSVDVTNYVVLSNIYGTIGRWKEVARLKRLVRDLDVMKLAGCSLIEVGSDIVGFHSSDTRHSRTWEIYETLQGLAKLLKSIDHQMELNEVFEETWRSSHFHYLELVGGGSSSSKT